MCCRCCKFMIDDCKSTLTTTVVEIIIIFPIISFMITVSFMCEEVLHLIEIYPSILSFIRPSIYPSVCPFICLPVCLAVYLSVYLSIYLSIYLSTYPSITAYLHQSCTPLASTHLHIVGSCRHTDRETFRHSWIQNRTFTINDHWQSKNH